MIADQVVQIIEEIAIKLGVAAEMVYPMLVKQADVFCNTYRIGIWIFAIAATIAVAFAIGYVVMYVTVRKYEDRIREVSAIAAAGFGVAALIAGIILLKYISEYVTAMYNPDVWVIQYVLKLMGMG